MKIHSKWEKGKSHPISRYNLHPASESCRKHFMKSLITLISLLPIALLAENQVSNAELSKKLDLILDKVSGLEKRVSKLESENTAVRKEVRAATQSAKEAKSVTAGFTIPMETKEKESFFKRMKNEITTQAAKDSGPWAKKSSWALIKRNLTRAEVRRILGNPHKVKINNDPRIDQIYYYSGDLDADGKENVGLVQFFKDRVVSFQSPYEG